MNGGEWFSPASASTNNYGAGPRYAANSAALPILDKARKRLAFVGFVFGLVFLMIIGRLFDVMILGGGEEKAKTAPAPVLSARADIVDRNGELLATSLRVASLSADPALILSEKETLQKLKTVFPDLDTVQLSKEFHSGKRFIWVRRNLSPKQQDAVNRLGLTGIDFVTEAQRFYPKGSLTAHIIGYNNVDHEGLAGLEHSFNDKLKNPDAPPLELAMDMRLQGIMRDAIAEAMVKFQAIGGAGIMMDVHTGEILSMVSLPDFDPSEAGKATPDTLFNRATLGVYEMGSTFKTFAIAQALDRGAITLGEKFNCTHPLKIGKATIHDFHPAGRWLNVPEIYLESSNIGASLIIDKVGSAPQRDFMKALGLMDKAPLEISEVGAPMLPPKEWSQLTMMTVSYGHGIAVNAVQLASATASIINGGHRVKPTLLKLSSPPALGPAVISPRTSEEMRRLMRVVVSDGTGKSASVPGYVVGGKTGTADKNSGHGYHTNARLSSFISAFPMQDPKYLILIMIDEPKGTKDTYGFATGGWTAAPAVARVIAQSAPLLHVKPVDENDPAVLEKVRLPVAFSAK